ncbi:uncharacterized protein [Nicotiana tomentosiformis]|uniref:uncharacterized protein n=1 Tax=Nicotiana tomentosiformis TaxID=4098 RepID=UPI00388C8118
MWASFLKHKYCIRAHHVAKQWTSVNSHSWKHLTKVRKIAEQHMVWHINEGNSIFWWDNWTCKGPLANLTPGTYKNPKILVREFIQNGEWNINKLQDILPSSIVQHIKKIEIGNYSLPDKIYWDLSLNGRYSNKTTTQLIRKSKPKEYLLCKVWHSSIPFKISFLTWTLWYRKLPFDDVIVNFGRQIVSRCNCCANPKNETIQHVFMEGEATSYIWKLIGSPLGIIHHQRTVRYTINKWWQVKERNVVHKLILQITPTIICWAIWKERCSCKYGSQKKFNLFRMEQQPIPKAIVVNWNKPEDGYFKLNTDGSFIK